MASSEVLLRYASNSGSGSGPPIGSGPPRSSPQVRPLILTSRSGSSNGSGRRTTPLTTLKMAVVAPVASASVRMAAAAKPGFLTIGLAGGHPRAFELRPAQLDVEAHLVVEILLRRAAEQVPDSAQRFRQGHH